jgi:hypothetical protein
MADVSEEVLDRQPAAILGRAIQKAIDGGWKEGNGWLLNLDNRSEEELRWKLSPLIIFNHDFAKALWGEEHVDSDYGTTLQQYEQQVKDGMHYPHDYQWNDLDYAWGYHLKHMVIADDPIKYLGENI